MEARAAALRALELVGMTTEGGWMVNFMKQTYPDVEWKAVQIPSGPVTRADVIFTNGIGVNAASEFPHAAAALAMYLTRAENQAEIVNTGFAYSTHPEQADLVQDPNDMAISSGGLRTKGNGAKPPWNAASCWHTTR